MGEFAEGSEIRVYSEGYRSFYEVWKGFSGGISRESYDHKNLPSALSFISFYLILFEFILLCQNGLKVYITYI